VTGELPAAAHHRRRLVAALLGRPAPGVLRPLVWGVVLALALVAVPLLERWA
jgi:hypothetical protein